MSPMSCRKCRNGPLSSVGRLAMRASKTASDFFQDSYPNPLPEPSTSGSKIRTDVPLVVNRGMCIRRIQGRMSDFLTFAAPNRIGRKSPWHRNISVRRPHRGQQDVPGRRCNCCQSNPPRLCHHIHETLLCFRTDSERTPRVMPKPDRMTAARGQV